MLQHIISYESVSCYITLNHCIVYPNILQYSMLRNIILNHIMLQHSILQHIVHLYEITVYYFIAMHTKVLQIISNGMVYHIRTCEAQ